MVGSRSLASRAFGLRTLKIAAISALIAAAIVRPAASFAEMRQP